MSFLKKTIGLFVEFEDENGIKQTKLAEPQAQMHQTQVRPAVQASSVSAISAANREELDKYIKHFNEIFDKRNTDGPDYYEFAKSMESLEAAIPDEATRVNAVYSMLHIQGVDKHKLVETANYYKKVFETDSINFKQAIQQKTDTDIVTSENRIKDLKNSILEFSKQIEQLTMGIVKANSEIEQLSGSIAENSAKIGSNQRNYDCVYQAILSKIDADISKIETMIR